MMNTMPKLLPWLARKAGISNEQAQALWRDAVAQERLRVQSPKNPDLFYRGVIEYFQRCCAQQNPRPIPAPRAKTSSVSDSKRVGGDSIGPDFAIA